MQYASVKYKRLGLSLVELLVVVTIVSLLITVAMVNIYKGAQASKKQRCRDQMRAIVLALDRYYIEHDRHYPEAGGGYSSDQEAFVAFLNDRHYFPQGPPRCPEASPDQQVTYYYVKPEIASGVLPDPTTLKDPIVYCTVDPSHGGFPERPEGQ